MKKYKGSGLKCQLEENNKKKVIKSLKEKMNRKLMTLDKGVEWLGPSTNISTFANLETTVLRKNYS